MAIEFVRVDTIPDGVDAVAGFAGVGDLDAIARAAHRPLRGAGGLRGEAGELLSGTDGAGRPLVVAGVGARDALDARAVRRAAAELGRALQHAASIAVVLGEPVVGAVGPELAARAVAEGVALGVHRFAGHKSQPKPIALARVAVVGRRSRRRTRPAPSGASSRARSPSPAIWPTRLPRGSARSGSARSRSRSRPRTIWR